MHLLTLGFALALAVSLVTGRAYFRGVCRRDETPARYWRVVACYAVLAAFGLVAER